MENEPFEDLVNRCFEKVRKHMGWNIDETALWFRTENPNFGGATPDDFMLRRPNKFEKVLDSMIDESTPPKVTNE